jgi:SWIM zinc finger
MTASAARQQYREVLAGLAAKAKEKLPLSVNGRLESAVKLVLQDEVTVLDDGSITVGSCTDPSKTYALEGLTCSCEDFQHGRSPGGWCKHRIAAGLHKRLHQVLAVPQVEAPPAPQTVPEPAPPAPVPVHEPVQGIDPKFIVWIQQRPFVRHAGLLKLAHERGLVSLVVDWTSNSDELSLAHAVAVFADGRRFEESADSTPQNVGKKVALHWRRLSLTRASARALRLALGVDLVAVEELMAGEEV